MTIQTRATLTLLIIVVACAFTPALAAGMRLGAFLNGLNEVPTIITRGTGEFSAEMNPDGIAYKLAYRAEGPVLAAHIHLGQAFTNGGVAVVLCSNMPDAPAGVQACPETEGEIQGVIIEDDVIGPEGQGLMRMEHLMRAVRSGATYVNVHSERFPGGELRGQIRVPRLSHGRPTR